MDISTSLVNLASGLIGSLLGATASYVASARSYRLERAKLLGILSKSEELEKTRIASYRELWKCFGGISSHAPHDIVGNLNSVQEKLQSWYYDGGGGLFLTGSASKSDTLKSRVFAARELLSNDPIQIWQVFHQLRHALRTELGIFESDDDEAAAIEKMKKKIGFRH
jgi:hypothetical protein